MIKKASLPSPIEVAVLGYCIWQASDLITSWVTAPAVRYAWIAFIIWCAPAVYYVTHTILKREKKESEPILLGAAIVVSLIGGIGSLHMLGHIGLALAIAGLMPFRPLVVIWLFTAISWLPSFGWMLKSLPFVIIPIIQIVLASFGSALLLFTRRRRS